MIFSNTTCGYEGRGGGGGGKVPHRQLSMVRGVENVGNRGLGEIPV